MDDRLKSLELFAWVGEDEGPTREIGLKQAIVPAGMIPIVATRRSKIDRPEIRAQLAQQARIYGRKISLVRFTFAEILDETPCTDARSSERSRS